MLFMCSKTSVCNLSWNGGVFDTQESWRACQAETMRPEFTFARIELQQSRMPAYGLPNVDEWYQRWSELFFSWVGHWWKCTGVVVTSILIHPIILKNIWKQCLAVVIFIDQLDRPRFHAQLTGSGRRIRFQTSSGRLNAWPWDESWCFYV